MPITIGSNIASLASQRRLAEGTAKLSKTFERLSSGLRINRASDDAAGLAIADSLRASTKVSQTALRNTNDAVSVVNIISSALDSQKGILTRMAELAEQSANGTYTYTQRKALDKEYQSLIAEFDRIAATTSFNGKNLLTSDDGEKVAFQVGITGALNALLSVASANSHSLTGTLGMRTDYELDPVIDAFDLFLANSITNRIDDSAYHFSDKIVAIKDSQGKEREIIIRLLAVNSAAGSSAGSQPAIDKLDYFIRELKEDGTVGSILSGGNNLNSANDFTSQVDLTFSDTGATASYVMDYSDLRFEHHDTTGAVYQSPASNPKILVESPVNESAIGFTNIRYRAHAGRALDVIRNRMNELSSLQSDYGAVQSRLQTAASNLTVSAENFAAAESRIRDADIAEESAGLVRLNILQQAAASVLAQANQQPQLALKLLGGVQDAYYIR